MSDVSRLRPVPNRRPKTRVGPEDERHELRFCLLLALASFAAWASASIVFQTSLAGLPAKSRMTSTYAPAARPPREITIATRMALRPVSGGVSARVPATAAVMAITKRSTSAVAVGRIARFADTSSPTSATNKTPNVVYTKPSITVVCLPNPSLRLLRPTIPPCHEHSTEVSRHSESPAPMSVRDLQRAGRAAGCQQDSCRKWCLPVAAATVGLRQIKHTASGTHNGRPISHGTPAGCVSVLSARRCPSVPRARRQPRPSQ